MRHPVASLPSLSSQYNTCASPALAAPRTATHLGHVSWAGHARTHAQAAGNGHKSSLIIKTTNTSRHSAVASDAALPPVAVTENGAAAREGGSPISYSPPLLGLTSLFLSF